MKLYKWIGTELKAKEVVKGFQDDSWIQLKSKDEILLLHEADKSSIEYTEVYEVLDQTGELQKNCFAVLNNVPVTEEGKVLFEQRFQKRAKLIEHEPGFIAIVYCDR